MFKMEDEAKKMAELLRSGHKMLNIACPECNNPIFQDRSNNMFCSVCNRKVIYENQTEIKKEKKDLNEKISNTEEKSEEKSVAIEQLIYDTKSVLIEKYDYILEKLKNENQIHNISQYIKILENLLIFLENLKP